MDRNSAARLYRNSLQRMDGLADLVGADLATGDSKRGVNGESSFTPQDKDQRHSKASLRSAGVDLRFRRIDAIQGTDDGLARAPSKVKARAEDQVRQVSPFAAEADPRGIEVNGRGKAELAIRISRDD